MECLIGYIGLSRAFDTQPAESGLYVDALPDISLSDFGKLTDSSESTESLWEEIQQRAAYKFRTLFIREVNKCHRLSDVSKCECLICSNKELLAPALWYLVGAEVQFARESNSRQNTYTVLDHGKARELREHFEELFARELETAVRSMDIHRSPCFQQAEEQPDERDIVRFATPIL